MIVSSESLNTGTHPEAPARPQLAIHGEPCPNLSPSLAIYLNHRVAKITTLRHEVLDSTSPAHTKPLPPQASLSQSAQGPDPRRVPRSCVPPDPPD